MIAAPGDTAKVCTKCKTDRPLVEFGPKKAVADGLRSQCRHCDRAAARDWAARNRNRTPEPTVAAKKCTWCHTQKPANEFYPRPIARDGLTQRCAECVRMFRRAAAKQHRARETEYTRRWRADHPGHYEAYMRAWRARNTDRVAMHRRRWAEENAEDLARLKRRWAIENRDALVAYRAENAEQLREANRRYRESHRQQIAERSRSRQRWIAAGDEITDADLASIWTGACAVCEEPIDETLSWPDPLAKSIDHIVPFARGGEHALTNLQWVHLFCNLSKGAFLMPELAGRWV